MFKKTLLNWLGILVVMPFNFLLNGWVVGSIVLAICVLLAVIVEILVEFIHK